jgi:hypothetical protein
MNAMSEPTSDNAAETSADASASAPKKELPAQPLVARRAKYFINMRYLFTVVLMGFGLYCIYDGYHAWPLHNQKFDLLDDQLKHDELTRAIPVEKDSEKKQNSIEERDTIRARLSTALPEFDPSKELSPEKRGELEAAKKKLGARKDDFGMMFNKVLGIALPPLSILLLWRWLNMSRGEYRLEDNVLSVPGHPPVKLTDITEIDTDLWKKKGILYVDYRAADGQEYTLKLDDFVYEQVPTDCIYEHIKHEMKSRVKEEPAASEGAA